MKLRCNMCGMVKHEDGGCGGPGQSCSGMPASRVQDLLGENTRLKVQVKILKEDKKNLDMALKACQSRVKLLEDRAAGIAPVPRMVLPETPPAPAVDNPGDRA